MKTKTSARCVLAGLVTSLLMGCSGFEPMDYQPRNAIPEGPGLISGKKGKWTIFRVEEKEDEPETREATQDEASQDQGPAQ